MRLQNLFHAHAFSSTAGPVAQSDPVTQGPEEVEHRRSVFGEAFTCTEETRESRVQFPAGPPPSTSGSTFSDQFSALCLKGVVTLYEDVGRSCSCLSPTTRCRQETEKLQHTWLSRLESGEPAVCPEHTSPCLKMPCRRGRI